MGRSNTWAMALGVASFGACFPLSRRTRVTRPMSAALSAKGELKNMIRCPLKQALDWTPFRPRGCSAQGRSPNPGVSGKFGQFEEPRIVVYGPCRGCIIRRVSSPVLYHGLDCRQILLEPLVFGLRFGHP